MTRTSVSLVLIIFVTLCYCMFGMHKDSCVCFFIIHTIQADCVIAHSIYFLGHDHCITCARINNFILLARKLKSSILLWLSLKKFCQFGGIFHLSVSLRLAPMPCFDLVSVFRLDDLKISKQCLFSCTWMSMLLQWGAYLLLHILQKSLKFVEEGSSPKLNHQ